MGVRVRAAQAGKGVWSRDVQEGRQGAQRWPAVPRKPHDGQDKASGVAELTVRATVKRPERWDQGTIVQGCAGHSWES